MEEARSEYERAFFSFRPVSWSSYIFERFEF